MSISNQFQIISPDFNYERNVVVKRVKKATKIDTCFPKINKFDLSGCVPVAGQISGLIRLVLSIIDLVRLRSWTPYQNAMRKARIAKLGRKEKNKTADLITNDKTKAEYKRDILLNVGRSLIEMTPIVGQVAMIGYAIILNNQQKTIIRKDVETKLPDLLKIDDLKFSNGKKTIVYKDTTRLKS